MANIATKKPDDFVISTGKNYSVKKFIDMCAKLLDIKLKWTGKGINSKAFDQNGNCIIECDKRYYRPTEVDILLGDSTKAKKLIKWKPKISFKELVKEMVEYDFQNLKKTYREKK
jgi:GDPmannose 4,6-dehydratase